MSKLHSPTPRIWKNVAFITGVLQIISDSLINQFPIEGDFKMWASYAIHPLLGCATLYSMLQKQEGVEYTKTNDI